MSLLPDREEAIIIPIGVDTSQVTRVTQGVVQDAQKMKKAYEQVGTALKKIFPDIADQIEESVAGLNRGVDSIERQVLATNKLIAAEERLAKTRSFSQAKSKVSSASNAIESELSFAERVAAEKARANAPTTSFARAQGLVSSLQQEQEFLQKVSDEKQRYAKASEQAANSSKKLEEQTKKTSSGFSSMINVIKGALTAMLTLAALRKVTEFFTGALDAAQQFRAQIVQLNFSEVILSKKGMDITRAELDKFIADIEERYQYLSKLDATKIVSETAGAVQEFDVSKNQLSQLSDAIAYIQLQNKLLGREEADAAHIINAAMDARSNFFNGMGINITETIVKEKAYKMGLVEVGEELTKQQRFQAILALLTEQTSGKQAELVKQLQGTAIGNQLKAQKDWADTLEKIGESLLTVKDALISFWASINAGGSASGAVIDLFQNLSTSAVDFINELSNAYDAAIVLSDAIDNLTGSTDSLAKVWSAFGNASTSPLNVLMAILKEIGAVIATLITGVISFFARLKAGISVGDALYSAFADMGQVFVTGTGNAIKTALGKADNPFTKWIKDKWKEAFGQDLSSGTPDALRTVQKTTDTPTGSSMADGVETESDNVQKAVEKMHKEVLDEYLKMQQDIEDATVDFNRKMDDISSEYQFKRLDAERDYRSKISDINRDANRKVQDISSKQALAEAKARQDNINKEREYQNKLLELREEFLMDLDDALHARDARQILKLIRQYNLDKTQAERQHEIQQKEQVAEAKLRQQGYEAERKEAELERKRKLEDAAIAFREKMQQLAEDESRERLQAQLALQRKLQDIQTNMRQRLQMLGAGLVAEFNLTKQGLDAVLSLYRAYYGPGGAIDQIYAGAMARLSAGQGLAPGANPTDPQSQPGGYGYNHASGFAEGGTLIANKPTKVLMGEGGLEMATFTPLNKNGRDVNKVFSSLSGAGGGSMNGAIEVGLTLSPDLEARVIRNTLDKTADVILRSQRSK